MTGYERLPEMLRSADFSSGAYESRTWEYDVDFARLRALARFRFLPWYRRAWLTLTGKAPR